MSENVRFFEINAKIVRFFGDGKESGNVCAACVGNVDSKYLNKYGNFIIKGHGFLSEDNEYVLRGDEKSWSQSGPNWVFKFNEFEKVVPTSLEGITAYLCSGVIKGIGPKIAQRIVKKFGKDTLTILKESPYRLREVDGIGKKMVEKIIATYQQDVEFEKLMVFLSQYGITPKQITKIYSKYNSQAFEVINNNPYKMCDDIDGFGFKTADSIARKVGLPYDHYERLRASILYLLKASASSEGHLYLPEKLLLKRFNELLEGKIADVRFSEVLMIMEQNEDITRCDDMDNSTPENKKLVYLPYFLAMEKVIAFRIKRFIKPSENIIPNIMEQIRSLEKENGVTYAEQQIEGLLSYNKSLLTIITGGPGTGKSTLIKGIMQLLERNNQNVKLCMLAPTGRASKRMNETTGHEAKTIHRGLEFSYEGFQKNEDDPLDCDALIVDESSMIDTILMWSLVKAIARGTRIYLVGDADQLPPVGPGYPFRDLIASGACPVIHLNEVFRQKKGSTISANAQKINKGIKDLEMVYGEFEMDMTCKESLALQERIVERFMVLLAEQFKEENTKHPLYNVQVLTPTRVGNVGTVELNKKLQERLNPFKEGMKQVTSVNPKTKATTYFRIGDKVMQTSNDYNRCGGVFNGDLGMIKDITTDAEGKEIVIVEMDDRREVIYEKADFKDSVELAYACTIHKSQGSEFARVIQVVSSACPPMLMIRSLLYTGVTRAKKKVVLMGDYKGLYMCIGNAKSVVRYSQLSLFLKQQSAA